MHKIDYSYPLPEEKLIARFKPVFEKLTNGYSATLVALPHTGRTSHLRFITSQPNFLKKLGVDTKKIHISFVDIDKTNGDYVSFQLELINSLLGNSTEQLNGILMSSINSRDPYLLGQSAINIIKKLISKKDIVFVISLKEKVKEILKEIDNLMVHVQKSTSFGKISILWSIDTKTFRNYEVGHMSSSVYDNIFYFPTFDKEETEHSINRFALLKGKNVKKDFLRKSHIKTGGIAAFFHSYVLSENIQIDQNIFTEAEKEILADLISESKIENSLFGKITTQTARDFLNKNIYNIESFPNKLNFKYKPKAQDLLLYKLFREKINSPVTRDEVAKALWGNAWETKYSDWAIDKAISRLRNNLKGDEYQLITVKNIGYQLINL